MPSLGEIARRLKTELSVYRLVMQHPQTPRLAKILLWLAIAYVMLPFDLIPDFIPVIGHLDDLMIVPGLIYLALRVIPDTVMAECRQAVATETN
jgi:uncharacterized membrane protein YkvA (DUF1232 family)